MRLKINGGALEKAIEDAVDRAPEESCGFLAGSRGVVSMYMRAGNSAPDPTNDFAIDAVQQLLAEDACRENELQIYGLVHSHPASDATLSPSDRLTAANPALQGWYWLVLSVDPSHGGPMTRCWRVNDIGEPTEVDLTIVEI